MLVEADQEGQHFWLHPFLLAGHVRAVAGGALLAVGELNFALLGVLPGVISQLLVYLRLNNQRF